MMVMMMTRMTAKDDDTRGDSGMLGAAESAAGNQSLISVSMWKCTRSVPDDHCGDDDGSKLQLHITYNIVHST